MTREARLVEWPAATGPSRAANDRTPAAIVTATNAQAHLPGVTGRDPRTARTHLGAERHVARSSGIQPCTDTGPKLSSRYGSFPSRVGVIRTPARVVSSLMTDCAVAPSGGG